MKRSAKRSFSLLEVMAAVAIMGFAVITLLSCQGSALKNIAKITLRVRALAAAEAAMDEFLVMPYFEADAEHTFGNQQEVALPGYSDDPESSPFRIVRILAEHIPFEEQETMDLYPDEEEEEGLLAEEAEEEEEEFDPGEFISVRIEVRAAKGDKPLVSLVTWIPKPLTEQYKERQKQRREQQQ